MDLVVPVNPKVKIKESEKRDKYFDLARKFKKVLKHKNDSDNNSNMCARKILTAQIREEI